MTSTLLWLTTQAFTWHYIYVARMPNHRRERERERRICHSHALLLLALTNVMQNYVTHFHHDSRNAKKIWLCEINYLFKNSSLRIPFNRMKFTMTVGYTNASDWCSKADLLWHRISASAKWKWDRMRNSIDTFANRSVWRDFTLICSKVRGKYVEHHRVETVDNRLLLIRSVEL